MEYTNPALGVAASGRKLQLKIQASSRTATMNPMLVTAAAAARTGAPEAEFEADGGRRSSAAGGGGGGSTPGGTPHGKRASIAVVSRPAAMVAAAMEGASASERALRAAEGRIATIRNMESDRFLKLSAPEQAAVFEHRIVAHTCSRTAVIRREFGRGIYGYFVFLQYLIGVNVLLAAIAAGVFGTAYAALADGASFSMFFTGLYPASLRLPWLVTTSVIVGLPALGSLVYPVVYRRVVAAGTTDMYDANSGGDDREDVSIRLVTHAERRRRRVLSAAAFAALIMAQAGVTYGLFAGLATTRSSWSSLIIAFSNNALNFVQKFLSKRLTWFELHRKVTTHREADTVKLFILKFANVIILYVLKSLMSATAQAATLEPNLAHLSCAAAAPAANATAPAANATAPAAACDCPLLSQGWTFFWLLAFDVAFSVAVEPCVGMAVRKYRALTANRRGLSDYDVRLDFDVAEELVSVLYRQFIILLGAPVFPLITAMGVVAYVIEYYMDRAKLINLCKKTIIREEPMDLRLITVCTFVVSLAAAFSFPQGLLFTGLGYGMSSCNFFS